MDEPGCFQQVAAPLLDVVTSAPQLTQDASGPHHGLHLCEPSPQDLCLQALPLCLWMDLERQAAARVGDERVGTMVFSCCHKSIEQRPFL